MAMFDELGGLVASGPNLTRIASSIGATDDATRTAISAAVPILLAGLDKHARTFSGSDAVFNLVRGDDGSVLSDIDGHIERADSDGRGSTLVDAILGSRRSMVEQTISSSTELEVGPISQLLTTMAPLVVGIVGRKQTAEDLPAASVISALAEDRAEMESIGYGSWLGLLDGGTEQADTQNFVTSVDRLGAVGTPTSPSTAPLSPPRVAGETPGGAPPATALTASVPPAGEPTDPTAPPSAPSTPAAPTATPATSAPLTGASAFDGDASAPGTSGLSGAAKAGAAGVAGLGAAGLGAAAAAAKNPAEAAGAEAAARFGLSGERPSGDAPTRPSLGSPTGVRSPDMPTTPAPNVRIDDPGTPKIGGASTPGTKIEPSQYAIGSSIEIEEKKGRGWLKWLLPLALLVLFGFLLRACLSGDTDEVVAPEPATAVPTVIEEPTPEPTLEPTAVPTPIPTVEVEPEPEPAPQSTIGGYIEGGMLSTAYNTGSFDTLLGAVESSGLRDQLEDTGPYTLFAPTDDAFEALPPSLRDDLAENPDLMAQVLTYHLVPGSVGAQDLATGAINASDGQALFVDISDDAARINGAAVTASDIASTNGITHAIDQVLIPPSLFGSSRMTLNTVLGLGQITFQTGSAAITPDGEFVLDKAFAYLANSDARLAIGGHTDNVGSEAVNLELSQQRAESVMQALIERGIDASRLRAIGYGSSQPIADNDSDEGRALNRRIELSAS